MDGGFVTCLMFVGKIKSGSYFLLFLVSSVSVLTL